jgi:hypothetical protein
MHRLTHHLKKIRLSKCSTHGGSYSYYATNVLGKTPIGVLEESLRKDKRKKRLNAVGPKPNKTSFV